MKKIACFAKTVSRRARSSARCLYGHVKQSLLRPFSRHSSGNDATASEARFARGTSDGWHEPFATFRAEPAFLRGSSASRGVAIVACAPLICVRPTLSAAVSALPLCVFTTLHLVYARALIISNWKKGVLFDTLYRLHLSLPLCPYLSPCRTGCIKWN